MRWRIAAQVPPHASAEPRVWHVKVAVARRRRRIPIEFTRLSYHTDHVESHAGLLPDGNRPANRAATFARHTEAIKQLKQKARAIGTNFSERNES
jgi:hypothetical protein